MNNVLFLQVKMKASDHRMTFEVGQCYLLTIKQKLMLTSISIGADVLYPSYLQTPPATAYQWHTKSSINVELITDYLAFLGSSAAESVWQILMHSEEM